MHIKKADKVVGGALGSVVSDACKMGSNKMDRKKLLLSFLNKPG